MAVVPCPECANGVSQQARACPSCGNPMRRDLPGWAYLLASVGLVAGAGVLLGVLLGAGKPKLVSAKEAAATCYANNDDTHCTFTNTNKYAIATCLRGRVTPTKASGVNLFSITLCSGEIRPLETKTVAAPWAGGRPKDLCNSKIGNTEILDWEQCSFTTEDVTP